MLMYIYMRVCVIVCVCVFVREHACVRACRYVRACVRDQDLERMDFFKTIQYNFILVMYGDPMSSYVQCVL